MRVRVTIVRRAMDFVSGHVRRAEAKHAQYPLPRGRIDAIYLPRRFSVSVSTWWSSASSESGPDRLLTMKTKNVFTIYENDGRIFRVIAWSVTRTRSNNNEKSIENWPLARNVDRRARNRTVSTRSFAENYWRERKSKKRFRMENVQILKEIGLFSKV